MAKHKIGDLYPIVVKIVGVEDEGANCGYVGDVLYHCKLLNVGGEPFSGDNDLYLDGEVLTKPLTPAAAKKITDAAIRNKIAEVNERMALLKNELANLTKQLEK